MLKDESILKNCVKDWWVFAIKSTILTKKSTNFGVNLLQIPHDDMEAYRLQLREFYEQI